MFHVLLILIYHRILNILYFPMLYSRTLLFIHSIHHSWHLIQNWHSLPPWPLLPLGNHKSVFYVCESVSAHRYVCLCCILDSIYLVEFWAPKSLQMVTAAMKLKGTYSLEESYDQPRQHIKKQKYYFANKCLSNQGNDFSSGHVWMWELDYKERIDAFELWCWRRLLRLPWTARRSNQSILRGISLEYSLEALMLKL